MSDDIKVTDGTILEALNSKIDYDGGNYAGSGLETVVNNHLAENTGLNNKITNCLLEVPQRIKYTLENGTLTNKAESVFIFPYGTQDRTQEFLKGSRFLSDYLIVEDTQYIDGKFFVWAKQIEDITYQASFGASENLRTILMGVLNGVAGCGSVWQSGCYSGETAPTTTINNTYWYNTVENLIYYSNDKGVTWLNDVVRSLPIATCYAKTSAGVIDTINQVFNGIGYIGSTIWVDKGVKGLIPNGRNEDGTLNNIEFTNNKILTFTNTSWTGSATALLGIGYLAIWSDNDYHYNEELNTTRYRDNTTISKVIKISSCDLTSGVISNFQTKQPIRLASTDMVDGQWVGSTLQISTSKAKGTYNLDLSDYLPKDNYIYEVKVATLVDRGSSGRAVMFLSSSIIPKFHFTASGNACTPNTGTADIAIGVDRKLTMIIETNAFDTVSLNAIAYRRLGHIQ